MNRKRKKEQEKTRTRKTRTRKTRTRKTRTRKTRTRKNKNKGGDFVMSEEPGPLGEVPPPPPPAEPPPVLKSSPETDAMMLAAIHPYGHEEPLEISRTEFESIVRNGSYFDEDTLEDLPTEEVVEGVNRELDLMKSFPENQAVPRSEVTGKVWSTRWC